VIVEYKGDKLDVNLIDEGKGDCIAILHGWGAYGEVYRLLIDLLKTNFRVIAPDMPGFGKTTEPSFAYDADDYAEFVKLLLEKLGVCDFSLIGHSHGGRTAIALCTGEGHIKPKSLVLIDSAGIPAKKTLKKTFKVKTYKALKGMLSFAPVAKVFPNALENMKKKFGSSDYAAASDIMRKSMVKVINSDMTERLHKITVPTLLIWGENDTATPISDAKLMEKLIPDCGLVTVRNAGHFSFADDFALTSRVLRSFYKF